MSLLPRPEEGVFRSVVFRRFVIFSRGPVPEPCSCDLLSVYSASWGVALLRLLALSRQRGVDQGVVARGPGEITAYVTTTPQVGVPQGYVPSLAGIQ